MWNDEDDSVPLEVAWDVLVVHLLNELLELKNGTHLNICHGIEMV